ncbi:MAG: hypothetical protein WAV28_06460 [Sedimentisphaerales bacterium]
MSTDSVEIIPDGQIHLPDELQRLLEKQIELARQGNISEIEVLSKQASSLVSKIARSGLLESSEFKSQREQLRKSYQDLCLALTAQKAETTKEISRVRKGKKSIKAYRSNI